MSRIVSPRDLAERLVSVQPVPNRSSGQSTSGRNAAARATPLARNVTIRGVAVPRPVRLSPEQAHELLEAWRSGALPPVSRLFLDQLLQHGRSVPGNSAMGDADVLDLVTPDMAQELHRGDIQSDQPEVVSS